MGLPGGINTRSGGGANLIAYEHYDRRFLKYAIPRLAWWQFAQKRPLPRYSGDSITFTRYSTFARATTALTEGTTPATGKTLTASLLSATAREWGDYVAISSFLDLTSIDPKVSETSALLGIQAGETVDYILQADTLTASEVTANYIYPTGQHFSAGNVTSTLDTSLVRQGVYRLRKAKAIRFEGNYWVAIISPESEFDLTGDTAATAAGRIGWMPTQQYAGAERIFQGEIGKWFGVRFVEDTSPITFDVSGTISGNGDGAVHPCAIFGQEAYGATELDGRKIIVKESGPQDTSNPLNMYRTVGWKQVFANRVLNPDWIRTIVAGATLSG